MMTYDDEKVMDGAYAALRELEEHLEYMQHTEATLQATYKALDNVKQLVSDKQARIEELES